MFERAQHQPDIDLAPGKRQLLRLGRLIVERQADMRVPDAELPDSCRHQLDGGEGHVGDAEMAALPAGDAGAAFHSRRQSGDQVAVGVVESFPRRRQAHIVRRAVQVLIAELALQRGNCWPESLGARLLGRMEYALPGARIPDRHGVEIGDPAPGAWTVTVTSYDAGETGAYTLTTRTEPVPAPPTPRPSVLDRAAQDMDLTRALNDLISAAPSFERIRGRQLQSSPHPGYDALTTVPNASDVFVECPASGCEVTAVFSTTTPTEPPSK